ncbi:MAG: aminotransferase class V-fold PLP-dependent enzyme, partial [Methanomicrobiales archaeon]|nr:aminotransferase class V-fold PLP-dependent enzyme [Methanomicrobiales archaeon]
MDVARVVPGARRGFQAVTDTYVGKGDPVLITALSHYTEVLAIEGRGGAIREIPKSAGNIITADAAAETIEAVIREFGRPPVLLFLDHYDYQYGNCHPVAEIIGTAQQYDIPVLYNGAYTVGIMEVDGKSLGADFVVGSGHKSMAAPAPSGILAATAERAAEVFRTTGIKTDVTGRTFGIKEVGMMGCTLMGVTLMGMMASFPHVRERVKRWDKELSNGNLVVEALKAIDGTVIRSEYPRKHTLTRVDTINSFDRVAKTHKKRGYFFSSALKERGIAGIIPGATKVWKFNTYGMTRIQAEYVAATFREIAEENGLPVSI